MARTPVASSVVALTRSRPSRMVNGICADGDRERAGQQRRLDDLLQPGVVLGLPAVAGADRGLEGARIEPGEFCMLQRHGAAAGQCAGNADALRPWLASVICIEARPAGIARVR